MAALTVPSAPQPPRASPRHRQASDGSCPATQGQSEAQASLIWWLPSHPGPDEACTAGSGSSRHAYDWPKAQASLRWRLPGHPGPPKAQVTRASRGLRCQQWQQQRGEAPSSLQTSEFDSPEEEPTEDEQTPIQISWPPLSQVNCSQFLVVNLKILKEISKRYQRTKELWYTRHTVFCTRRELSKYRVPSLLDLYQHYGIITQHQPIPVGRTHS
ncbi:hypothetical protein QTO34_009333 [Cnephaeus nilssonii]|uniref:protein-tyrosine-phosphatase n=1 Tax=Cnephaeus nilssonii TaxID=3371016 RepID=A0AA40LGV8_CNENI|nr:hypothetical protein QTO34_009333 [Eptesicus nilssonii]